MNLLSGILQSQFDIGVEVVKNLMELFWRFLPMHPYDVIIVPYLGNERAAKEEMVFKVFNKL